MRAHQKEARQQGQQVQIALVEIAANPDEDSTVPGVRRREAWEEPSESSNNQEARTGQMNLNTSVYNDMIFDVSHGLFLLASVVGVVCLRNTKFFAADNQILEGVSVGWMIVADFGLEIFVFVCFPLTFYVFNSKLRKYVVNSICRN